MQVFIVIKPTIMAMTKERQQEILQHKINYYTDRYNLFILYGISSKKIDKVDMLKDQYIATKAIVDAS